MADTVTFSKMDGDLGGDQLVRSVESMIAGQLPDGTAVYMPVQVCGQDLAGAFGGFVRDFVTSAQQSIDVGHANTHAKRAFEVSSHVAIASGKTAAIRIVTPAATSGYVHLQHVSVGGTAGPLVATLLEDYTVTGSFGTITPVNMNRNSPPASTCTVTGTADGTLTAGASPASLGELYLPGTSTGAKVGADANTYYERILKPGTTYILAILNSTSPGATATAYYNLAWYEEPLGA